MQQLDSDDFAGRQADVARRLVEILARTYSDPDVGIQRAGSTVTIARGRRAVQIFVMRDDQFQVSRKKRETFHTMKDLIGPDVLAEVIRGMIGGPGDERD